MHIEAELLLVHSTTSTHGQLPAPALLLAADRQVQGQVDMAQCIYHKDDGFEQQPNESEIFFDYLSKVLNCAGQCMGFYSLRHNSFSLHRATYH